MSVRALEKAKERATLVTQVSRSAGGGVWVPAVQWWQLLAAIDAVVAEDKENRR